MPKTIEAPPSTLSSPKLPSPEVQPGLAPAVQSLMDVRRVLLANKYLIISIVAVSIIVSFIYAKTRVPLYEATATAEIDTSRGQSIGLSDIVGSSPENGTTQVQTQAFRLTGSSLVFRAVSELGAEGRGPYPNAFKKVSVPITEDSLPAFARASIVGAVSGSLKVSIVPRTNAVRLTYRHPSPVVARDLVNKLLDVFMERSVEDRLFGTNQAAGMLAVQMEDLKNHAADAQRKLAKFQEEHNFVGTDENDNLTTAGLKIINEQLAEAQADQIIKRARVHLVESGNPELLTSVAPTPTLRTLRAQETSVKVELGQLASKYGPGYPRVHELQAQLPSLEKEIAVETSNVTRRVQEEYQTSSNTVQSLQERLNAQTQQAFKLNESAAQYALLREDAESSRDLYDVLQLKLKESSVSAALNAASISIIDHAVIAPYPVEPNKRRVMMTGGLAGFILAVFLAFLIEALNDTLQTSEDLETWSRFQALGAVPHFEAQPRTIKDSDGGQRSVLSRLITYTSTESLAAESFRTIRSSIMLSSADRQSKVIVITSSFMAEGKSTLSSNLAIALAQRGARVLLVDSDLRRGTLHNAFHLTGSLPGLSNLLSMSNERDVFITPVPEVPTLTLLPAGPKPPNPAELLTSNRMAELIHKWRDEYDHVVLDSAPILMVSDALAVAARADGTVMIIRAGLTRKKAISRAFELLSRSNVRILGAVMNDINLKIENYYTYSSRRYRYNYYGYNGQGDAYGTDRDPKKP
jgi:capsular exopolysaccharide synthesis family protein